MKEKIISAISIATMVTTMCAQGASLSNEGYSYGITQSVSSSVSEGFNVGLSTGYSSNVSCGLSISDADCLSAVDIAKGSTSIAGLDDLYEKSSTNNLATQKAKLSDAKISEDVFTLAVKQSSKNKEGELPVSGIDLQLSEDKSFENVTTIEFRAWSDRNAKWKINRDKDTLNVTGVSYFSSRCGYSASEMHVEEKITRDSKYWDDVNTSSGKSSEYYETGSGYTPDYSNAKMNASTVAQIVNTGIVNSAQAQALWNESTMQAYVTGKLNKEPKKKLYARARLVVVSGTSESIGEWSSVKAFKEDTNNELGIKTGTTFSFSIKQSDISLVKGKTKTLKPSAYIDKKAVKTFTYKSNKPSVAKVDSNGKVTAVKPGKATITVKAKGISASIKVNVHVVKSKEDIKATSLSVMPVGNLYVSGDNFNTSVGLSGNNLFPVIKGQKYSMAAFVTPKNVNVKNVQWKSSNTKVAKVSPKGVVTIVGKGKATITAKTTDGSKLKAKIRLVASKAEAEGSIYLASDTHPLGKNRDGAVKVNKYGVYATDEAYSMSGMTK